MDVPGVLEGLVKLCGSLVEEAFTCREFKLLHARITVANPAGRVILAPSVFHLVSPTILF